MLRKAYRKSIIFFVIIISLVIYYVSTTIPQTVASDSSVPLLPFPVPECITLLSLHSSFVNESVIALVIKHLLTDTELGVGYDQCEGSQETEEDQVEHQVDEEEQGNVSGPLPAQQTLHHRV